MSEKSMRLAQAMGAIDERMVDDALRSGQTTPQKLRRRYAALAACICLLSTAVLIWSGGDRGERWFPVERIVWGTGGDGAQSIATSYVLRWEEKQIFQQYPALDDHWHTTGAVLPQETVGDYLRSCTLTGYDEYDPQAVHTVQAEVYTVQGISPDCVLAVRYNGTGEWYCFVNYGYRPETLGQFWQDLDLNRNLQLSTAHYNYQKVFGMHASVTLTGVTTEMVWEQLITEAREIPNEHSDLRPMHRTMDLRVDIPLLGIHGISLAVTEDGWLTTNILATGKSFYLGPEKTQAFEEFLKANLEGSELLYPYFEPPFADPDEGEWGGDASVPPVG